MHVSGHVCIAMSICILNIKCWCTCVGEKPKPNTVKPLYSGHYTIFVLDNE